MYGMHEALKASGQANIDLLQRIFLNMSFRILFSYSFFSPMAD